MSELTPLLQGWAVEDVGRVLRADARPKGVGDVLTALDRVALLWLYVAAFADEMQSRCEDEEEKRINTLAQSVLCRALLAAVPPHESRPRSRRAREWPRAH